MHVWRGAEAHRAAREGVEGLCRAHDALVALLRALLLPPGTPICLATQARLPPLGASECPFGFSVRERSVHVFVLHCCCEHKCMAQLKLIKVHPKT